jgi:hypothetical protein
LVVNFFDHQGRKEARRNTKSAPRIIRRPEFAGERGYLGWGRAMPQRLAFFSRGDSRSLPARKRALRSCEREKFQTWPIPSGGGVVRNMTADHDRNIELAESGVDRVALLEIKE